MATLADVTLDTRGTLAKVERARTRLFAQDPWFGALGMSLRIVADTRHPLMATDGTRVLYNPAGCAIASEPELIFVWAHEILHCGLLHMFRKPSWVEWHEWNVCTDLAINDVLISKGLGAAPKGILHDAQYAGLAAETIAHLRRKARQQQAEQEQAAQAAQAAQDSEPEPEQPDQQDSEPADSDVDQDADSEPEDGEPADSDAGEPDAEQDGTGTDGDADSGSDAEQDGQDGTGAGASANDAGEQGSQEGTSGVQANVPTRATQNADDGTLEPGDDCLPPMAANDDGTDADGEPARTETDWVVAVDQAMAVARKAGVMDGGIERLIAGTRETRTDWREIMRRFAEQFAPCDYTYARPNRRVIGQGIYLPGTSKLNTPPLVVVVDTSGSIGQAELDVFAVELTNILQESAPRALYVIYCDTRVNGEPEIFTPEDGEVSLTAKGGGGTYFQPAFDYIAEATEDGTFVDAPAAIIYLTDGYAADLHRLTEPEIPTLFAIVPGGTEDMPFGEVVTIDVD